METTRTTHATHTLVVWRAGQATTHQIVLSDGPSRYRELEKLTFGADSYLVASAMATAGSSRHRPTPRTLRSSVTHAAPRERLV
jgi:predicted nicotinamide N-methyase